MKRSFLLALGLLASVLVAVPASAAPEIELLNPSDYTTALMLSDKADTDNAAHFVAWVKEVPANPIVEFEIQSAGQNADTIDGERVGTTDTWEAFVNLSGYVDGPGFTVRARLYSGQNEVSSTEELVTLNASDVPPPPESNTVEIVHPDNGGPLGFYTPRGKNTNTLIEVTASAGTNRIRAFYTMSDPGTDPEWVACGNASVPAGLTTNVRCTLREGDPASEVGAIAAVANRTPAPADPAPQADETGDAHRITSYTQDPTRIIVDPEATTANPATCQAFTARVLDQFSEPVALANVDVHAEGPNDQLRFAAIAGTTDGFQPPEENQGHPSRENTFRCSDLAAANQQGDHNRPGQDDQKHIESTDGTDNFGEFVFALRSADPGGTNVSIWSDDDDDEVQDASEGAGGARLGWGEPPPPPKREVFLQPNAASAVQGSCQSMTLTVRSGGNALAGANVDIHISGPDETVVFCDPQGANPRRPPDGGGHTADSHSDGTRHAEGETASGGTFVFGVTTGGQGSTAVLGWFDENPDDLLGSDEANAAGQIEWTAAGERTVSINTSDSRVDRGDRVRISGRIKGDPNCKAGQVVKLQSRSPGRRFRTDDAEPTNGRGRYSFRDRVNRTTDYRVVAPQEGQCRKARSPVKKVRAN